MSYGNESDCKPRCLMPSQRGTHRCDYRATYMLAFASSNLAVLQQRNAAMICGGGDPDSVIAAISTVQTKKAGFEGLLASIIFF